MAEYIEREALKSELQESYNDLLKIYHGLKYDEEKRICAGQVSTFLECILRVKDAPAADVVEVKRGRWVMTLYATTSKRGRVISNKKFACSECGYSNGRKQSNFCPNCGADMREVDHEAD